MRWARVAALAVLVAMTVVVVNPASAAPGATVTVTMDTRQVHTQLGGTFGLVTQVENDGDRARTGLVAHLNIVSMDPGVYVDPEDWSSHRTVYLDPLGPGESVDVPWRVKAVNHGSFLIYVAVSSLRGSADVAVSHGARVRVAQRQTINAGGVLPVVLGVPGGLALLALVTTMGRRRRTGLPA